MVYVADKPIADIITAANLTRDLFKLRCEEGYYSKKGQIQSYL